jgi:hypothetical protein
MSDFSQFKKLVFADPSLRDSLLAETELEPFLDLVVALARERGLTLTKDEVRREHQSAAHAWMMRQVQ